MVGAAGEQRVATRVPSSHDSEPDDTTSAQIVAPALPPDIDELSEDDLDESDDGDDEPEERTVQQAIPATVASAALAAAAKARSAPPLAPTKPSNQPVSLPPAPPPPPTLASPTAVRDAAKTDAADLVDEDDDPIEDSITATAPRLNAAHLMDAAQSGYGVPVSVPGRVEIRTIEEDDEADKTEVRTRPGQGFLDVPVGLRAGAPLPVPRPAAGRPPEPQPAPDGPDGDGPGDDGVTSQGPAPRVGSVPDIGAPLRGSDRRVVAAQKSDVADGPPTRPGVEGEPDEPLTRPGLGGESEPPTRPGLEEIGEVATKTDVREPPPGTLDGVSTLTGYANDEDDDESVTTRSSAEPYADDSVTTQAPNVPIEMLHAAIKAADAAAVAAGVLDDTGADTTQKVRKPIRQGSSPADGEAESITSQAPGLVTNMLRVIASGSSPELASAKIAPIDDEDDAPQNRTAIMANAPLQRVINEVDSVARLPAIRPTGGPLSHGPMGAAAPRLDPSSESGLRVARSGAASDERASLGHVIAVDARHSGALRASGPLADMSEQHLQPSLHDVDLGKGPSYGLLVAIVAVVSLVVPLILFLVLRHGSESEAAPPVTPSEPVSEIAKPGAARGKSLRGKNGQTIVPSATATASAPPPPSAVPSMAPSAKPGPKGPFGKH